MVQSILRLIIFAAAIVCIVSTINFFKKMQVNQEVTKQGPIVRLVDVNGSTYCSGTVVSETRIITAMHCLMVPGPFGLALNSEPVGIRGDDNVDQDANGTILCAHPQMDTAVLKGNFKMFKQSSFETEPAVLINDFNSWLKDSLTACGYPMGGKLFCTSLQLDGLLGFAWLAKGILIPGMSGGPTMTQDGTLVAVNSAMTENRALVQPLYNVEINCSN